MLPCFVLALQDRVALIVGKWLAQRLVALGQALGHLARHVLRLVDRLFGLVRHVTHGVLRLIRDLACLVGRLPGDILRLVGDLSDLVGRLPCGILRLVGDPTDRFLNLVGGSAHARGLVGGLLRLLGRLLRRVLHSSVLGRLVYGALELGVGVGHLLDLGLRLLGKLLHHACELGAVALQLALYPAHRLPEEVLGLLQILIFLRLLLRVLRSFAHFFSFFSVLSGSCSTVPFDGYSMFVFTLSLSELFQRFG